MLSFLGIGKSVIHISRSAYDEIINHAKESYPHECCGVLVGATYTARRIFESQRANNVNTERAHDRYIIDPKELNLIDKIARSQGMDVMGFYHSHPDHPDKPSETDREWGQPGYSYFIISVKGGKDVSVRSWMIEDEKGPFKEESIKINEKG
ncbi:M67 family metallopeptidase [bacterium]|nr:M67 family metallopeptidase [bacterium]